MKELSNCLILIVDDTDTNIDILLETLGDDYEISVAVDGEDAVSSVYEEKPDLILLDVMMPGMNGFEVCEKLKEDKETADIPVIFMTGKSESEDRKKAADLGALDYITKPFDIKDVQQRVKSHLENIITR